jgi:hypothetical protein
MQTARKIRIIRAAAQAGRRKMQGQQYPKPASPKGEKRAVALVRRPNAVYRKRELLAYRHGFRASEVCDLESSAIDFYQGRNARQP